MPEAHPVEGQLEIVRGFRHLAEELDGLGCVLTESLRIPALSRENGTHLQGSTESHGGRLTWVPLVAEPGGLAEVAERLLGPVERSLCVLRTEQLGPDVGQGRQRRVLVGGPRQAVRQDPHGLACVRLRRRRLALPAEAELGTQAEDIGQVGCRALEYGSRYLFLVCDLVRPVRSPALHRLIPGPGRGRAVPCDLVGARLGLPSSGLDLEHESARFRVVGEGLEGGERFVGKDPDAVQVHRAPAEAEIQQVTGQTVAEVGSGNYPLDMVRTRFGDKEFIVMSNSMLPLLTFDPSAAATWETGITEEVPTYTSGVGYVPRSGSGIQQLDSFNEDYLIALQRMPSGSLDLVSLSLEWLAY